MGGGGGGGGGAKSWVARPLNVISILPRLIQFPRRVGPASLLLVNGRVSHILSVGCVSAGSALLKALRSSGIKEIRVEKFR